MPSHVEWMLLGYHSHGKRAWVARANPLSRYRDKQIEKNTENIEHLVGCPMARRQEANRDLL